MPIVPCVLIPLNQDGVFACDQESGHGISREIILEGERLPPVFVADGRLDTRVFERRRRGGAADQAGFEDPIEIAVRADEEGYLVERRLAPDRIALARAVLVDVRAVSGEVRPGTRQGSGGGVPEDMTPRELIVGGDTQQAGAARSTPTANEWPRGRATGAGQFSSGATCAHRLIRLLVRRTVGISRGRRPSAGCRRSAPVAEEGR